MNVIEAVYLTAVGQRRERRIWSAIQRMISTMTKGTRS